MKKILLTGGIGSGKTAVSRILEAQGVPVWLSDDRTKDLYGNPDFLARIEAGLGQSFRDEEGSFDKSLLASCIFSSPEALAKLEGIVHPEVLDSFNLWAQSQEADVVAMESAIALEKPLFDGVFDGVILVDAPEALRIERASRRDNSDPSKIRARMEKQKISPEKADAVIMNDGSQDDLKKKTYSALRALKSKWTL